MGLLYAAVRFTTAYADYALVENFTLPGGEYVAWFSSWVTLAGLTLAGVFLMLLFAEGRLPSRRWLIPAWAAVCGVALAALVDAFTPVYLTTNPYVENPFGVLGAIGGGFTTYNLFVAPSLLGNTLVSMSTLAALFSLVLRLHCARGDERQQPKRFLYAAVPAVVCLSVILLHAYFTLWSTPSPQTCCSTACA
jgi:hypothetical protein